MKRKDFADLKEKSAKELGKIVAEKRSALSKAKLEAATGKNKNLKNALNIRREIAKILTLVREKEILGSLAPKVEKKGEDKGL